MRCGHVVTCAQNRRGKSDEDGLAKMDMQLKQSNAMISAAHSRCDTHISALDAACTSEAVREMDDSLTSV